MEGVPHHIRFGQAWWFGRTDQPTDEPFSQKMDREASYSERESERLVDRAIRISEIEERTGYSFPPTGSISSINVERIHAAREDSVAMFD